MGDDTAGSQANGTLVDAAVNLVNGVNGTHGTQPESITATAPAPAFTAAATATAPATAPAPAPAPVHTPAHTTPAHTPAHTPARTPAHTPAKDAPFSWLDPHPIFVIILVGPEEQPFGIQKDFLCARSAHYKKLFTGEDGQTNTVEHIVSLPETPVEVFAYAQNYLFTGRVFPNSEHLPSYDILIGVWKLGHHLEIDGLCEATLDAMSECRRITQLIPATPLLVQVWEDTPEGSSIRKLLLSWAAEYMRSSDSRAEFARSLPQGVLSELVVAMSSLDNDSPIPTASTSSSSTAGQKRPGAGAHCVEVEDGDEAQPPASKRARHSDVVPREATSPAPSKAAIKKPPLRASLPASKPAPRRRSGAASSDLQWSTQQKLTFCSDLLTRMLSGPGFWTRLVGPFKEPVDPSQDGVPDYLEKVTKPMDLGTMKAKMDRNEYANEEEFVADMNQIFNNCYTYWSKKDAMWAACERLQKTFEERYACMNKWLSKMAGEEPSS